MGKIKTTPTIIISIAIHSLETVVASFFKEEGYHVIHAKNYYEVIRKSSRYNVKYIVIGGTIENHDGINIAKRIKTFDNENRKKIIIIDVNLRGKIDEEEFEKDNIYFLHLPFRNEELKKIVSSHSEKPLKGKLIAYFGDDKDDLENIDILKAKYKFKISQIDSIENIKRKYDVIIIDAKHNIQEKLEYIKELRSIDDYELIPIIIINNTIEIKHYIDYGVSASYPFITDKNMIDNLKMYFSKKLDNKKYVLLISHDNLLNAYANFIICSIGFDVKFIKKKIKHDVFIKHRNHINTLIVNLDDDISYKSIIKEYKPSEEHPLIILSDENISVKSNKSHRYSVDFIQKPFENYILSKSIRSSTMSKQVILNLEYQNHLLNITNQRNLKMLSYGASEMITPTLLISNYAKQLKGNEALIIYRQSLILQRTIDVMVDYYSMGQGDIVLEKTHEDVLEIFKDVLERNHEILDSKNIRYDIDIKDDIRSVFVDRVILEKVFSSLMLYIFNMSISKYKVSFSFSNIDYKEESDALLDIFEIKKNTVSDNLEISLLLKTDKFITDASHDEMFNFTLYVAERFLQLHDGHLYKHKKDDYEHIVLLIPYG